MTSADSTNTVLRVKELQELEELREFKKTLIMNLKEGKICIDKIGKDSFNLVVENSKNTTSNEFQLLEQLRRLYLQNKFKSGEGIYYKAVVLGSDYEPGVNEHAVFSTKHYSRFTDLLNAVKNKIDEITAMYGVEEKDIKQVVISKLKTNLAS